MKPERLTEAPENAGICLDTTSVSEFYQEATLQGDVSNFSSSRCVSDVLLEQTGRHTK